MAASKTDECDFYHYKRYLYTSLATDVVPEQFTDCAICDSEWTRSQSSGPSPNSRVFVLSTCSYAIPESSAAYDKAT
jgi:hypothetical protein